MSKWSSAFRDSRWQKLRLKIMERDGWACRSCGATNRELNVHHVYYEAGRAPWEYPHDSLITWCSDCHVARHTLQKNALMIVAQLGIDLAVDIFSAVATMPTHVATIYENSIADTLKMELD
jgi:hypothetical protein